MKRKFLITGATGFVGSWVTRELIKRGESVSILVRDKELNWRLAAVKNTVSIYEADLLSPELQTIVDIIKPTNVIHIAAYGALPGVNVTIDQLLRTNVQGLINLLNAVKKHPLQSFINTGSSSEYGIKDKPMQESDMLAPINDYGVSKASATLYSQKFAITENIPLINLRLFSPYGYYDDPKRLISYVIMQALHNKPIALSNKNNVRDFIYIEDVVNAYMHAIYSDKVLPEIYNIGSGQQHSVYDIVDQIVTIIGSKSVIQWGGMPEQTRQIEPKLWQADITKAKESLQWSPEHTLHQGLEKAILQYKKNI